jgi:hypothetical protein
MSVLVLSNGKATVLLKFTNVIKLFFPTFSCPTFSCPRGRFCPLPALQIVSASDPTRGGRFHDRQIRVSRILWLPRFSDWRTPGTWTWTARRTCLISRKNRPTCIEDGHEAQILILLNWKVSIYFIFGFFKFIELLLCTFITLINWLK